MALLVPEGPRKRIQFRVRFTTPKRRPLPFLFPKELVMFQEQKHRDGLAERIAKFDQPMLGDIVIKPGYEVDFLIMEKMLQLQDRDHIIGMCGDAFDLADVEMCADMGIHQGRPRVLFMPLYMHEPLLRLYANNDRDHATRRFLSKIC